MTILDPSPRSDRQARSARWRADARAGPFRAGEGARNPITMLFWTDGDARRW
jgi:hypothetical protein